MRLIEEVKFGENPLTRSIRILYKPSWLSNHTVPVAQNLVVAINMGYWRMLVNQFVLVKYWHGISKITQCKSLLRTYRVCFFEFWKFQHSQTFSKFHNKEWKTKKGRKNCAMLLLSTRSTRFVLGSNKP